MTIPFAFKQDHLPAEIPIFPLTGAVLLPRGHLPLNIFEPRYLAMIDHAFKTDRIIGMMQPHLSLPDGIMAGQNPLSSTGCAGRITEFEETNDGHYRIVLTGICRFGLGQELPLLQGFRRVQPDWQPFMQDMVPSPHLSIPLREAIMAGLSRYFVQQQIEVDWQAVKHASDERLMTCLAMICPFTPAEKQALLEAFDCTSRAELFLAMLEMAVHGGNNDPETKQ